MKFKQKDPSKSQQPKALRKPVVQFQRVIDEGKLAILYRAADTVAGNDKVRRDTTRQRVARLAAQTAELDLLLNHARGYIAGDMRARNHFIGVLNQIVQRDVGARAGGSGPVRPGGPEGSDLKPFSGTFSGMLSRGPCFVGPKVIGDIFFGVMSLCEMSPYICRDYVAALDSLLVRVARLEVLYAAAHDVFEAFNPQTIEAFDTTLAVVEAWVKERPPVEPVFFNLTFGNPDPFPVSFGSPRGLLDFCSLEKWAATRDAELCFKSLRDEPRYEIEDIVNLTRSDREMVSRRGCVGDLIEIRGSNLVE